MRSGLDAKAAKEKKTKDCNEAADSEFVFEWPEPRFKWSGLKRERQQTRFEREGRMYADAVREVRQVVRQERCGALPETTAQTSISKRGIFASLFKQRPIFERRLRELRSVDAAMHEAHRLINEDIQ